MISRAQEKAWASGFTAARGEKLSSLEKAMLKWVVVDPEDRVLDADVGSGIMGEYLRRHMQCEVCGVSSEMENVRQARNRLPNCDIVYAPPGDIPWREDAFDIVLMKYNAEEPAVFQRRMSEAARILRPGGQLILGAKGFPAVIQSVVHLFAEEPEGTSLTQKQIAQMMKNTVFENISWQRTSFASGVLIAWKHKPAVAVLKEEVRAASEN